MPLSGRTESSSLMIAPIRPHDLPNALATAPDGITTLSLDCFDTLLWRHTHSPGCVFADIGEHGGTPQQRRWAESHARSHSELQRGCNEAKLAEIYAMLLPNASDEVRERGAQAELAAEARHCFAFRPTVELMREAKRRGLRIMVVSDTYLDRAELGRLIADAAGEEVRGLIDDIFCSSDYGLSKGEGLFAHVLEETGADPATVLHIGDNLAADCHGVSRFGVATRHLVQFTSDTEQRLRLEAAVGAVLSGAGEELPAFQPHRAQIALGEPNIADPAIALGYSVLGPLFRAFDLWLREEARALQVVSSGRVHMLFLMRDGHLPLRVFEATGGAEGVQAAAVEISRFAAQACTFESADAIDRFLARELATQDDAALANQLLFDGREALALTERSDRMEGGDRAFTANVRRAPNPATIIARSKAFGERLVRHVRAVADPRPGDTLMLVDLGYNGTVQSCIAPLLRRELGVDVVGRYLLLREQERDGFDKRGLFDSRHYDTTALDALCGNVAVFEQLCTVAQGSVVDYADDGQPIRKSGGLKARQSDVRERVQEGCLRFAREADAAMHRAPASDDADRRRQAAAAVMARFMFLPLPAELAVLKDFEHDVNLGVGMTVPLFDPAIAERELKRSGLSYTKDAGRMYLPAELGGHGMSLSLSLLTQRRFGLALRRGDFRKAGVDLPILVADGREVSTSSVEAVKTHDGFLSAVIPVGVSQYAIGLQFGRLYEWVEVASADFQAASALREKASAASRRRTAARPSFEGMEAVAERLMRCTDENAFMMVPPPGGTEPIVLTVVFRPIVSRERASGRTTSPARPAVVVGAPS